MDAPRQRRPHSTSAAAGLVPRPSLAVGAGVATVGAGGEGAIGMITTAAAHVCPFPGMRAMDGPRAMPLKMGGRRRGREGNRTLSHRPPLPPPPNNTDDDLIDVVDTAAVTSTSSRSSSSSTYQPRRCNATPPRTIPRVVTMPKSSWRDAARRHASRIESLLRPGMTAMAPPLSSSSES